MQKFMLLYFFLFVVSIEIIIIKKKVFEFVIKWGGVSSGTARAKFLVSKFHNKISGFSNYVYIVTIEITIQSLFMTLACTLNKVGRHF